MGTDWLRQLKGRLASGEWLTYTPEGEPEGVLRGVLVNQTRRMGLIYQQPGEDRYVQIFLNPDGTREDAVWSPADSREPEVYTEEEMSAVEQHIQNAFGKFETSRRNWRSTNWSGRSWPSPCRRTGNWIRNP